MRIGTLGTASKMLSTTCNATKQQTRKSLKQLHTTIIYKVNTKTTGCSILHCNYSQQHNGDQTWKRQRINCKRKWHAANGATYRMECTKAMARHAQRQQRLLWNTDTTRLVSGSSSQTTTEKYFQSVLVVVDSCVYLYNNKQHNNTTGDLT